VFDETPKSEISQWGLEKINYVDFLRIENFLSNFPKQNLDVGFDMLKEKLIFRGQERIDHLGKNFIQSEFMTINQKLVKIIYFKLVQVTLDLTFRQVVMVAIFFPLRHQVILVLRSTRREWID
jgi:hypothetical protein